MDRRGPSLQMNHGFLRKIEQNQFNRERQSREEDSWRRENGKLAAQRVGISLPKISKPAREIYRPPNLRATENFRFGTPPENGEVQLFQEIQSNAGQTVHERYYLQKEQPSQQNMPKVNTAETVSTVFHHQAGIMNSLRKCRSMTVAHKVRFENPPEQRTSLTSSQRSKNHSEWSLTSADYISEACPLQTVTLCGLMRSKSCGSANVRPALSPDFDIPSFSAEIQMIIAKAVNDPNMLHARELMEIVRHLFNQVLEDMRYGEPIAILCVSIIEKETTETFIETLLNSCREWFLERDQRASEVASSSLPNRWVTYVTFLYELYTRLVSRKQSSISRPVTTSSSGNGDSPAVLLLKLLSECCLLFMKSSLLLDHDTTECLFIVLSKIGRDLQNEYPQRMQQLMSAARDAFVSRTTPKSARMTLLQLIEMSASNWQLASSAVAYYYPNHLRQ